MRRARLVCCLDLIILVALPSFAGWINRVGSRHRARPFRSERLSGATVALVNNSTAFHYQQTSDAEGRFAFGLLPPGDYSARVTAEKMSPQLSPFLAGDTWRRDRNRI